MGKYVITGKIKYQFKLLIFYMFNKAKKIEQWKRAGPLSCYPLYSHEFESHGRHSYKDFPHLNFWGCIFSCAFYYILFVVCLFFCFDFLCVFCNVCFGCVVFCVYFLLVSFFFLSLI